MPKNYLKDVETMIPSRENYRVTQDNAAAADEWQKKLKEQLGLDMRTVAISDKLLPGLYYLGDDGKLVDFDTRAGRETQNYSAEYQYYEAATEGRLFVRSLSETQPRQLRVNEQNEPAITEALAELPAPPTPPTPKRPSFLKYLLYPIFAGQIRQYNEDKANFDRYQQGYGWLRSKAATDGLNQLIRAGERERTMTFDTQLKISQQKERSFKYDNREFLQTVELELSRFRKLIGDDLTPYRNYNVICCTMIEGADPFEILKDIKKHEKDLRDASYEHVNRAIQEKNKFGTRPGYVTSALTLAEGMGRYDLDDPLFYKVSAMISFVSVESAGSLAEQEDYQKLQRIAEALDAISDVCYKGIAAKRSIYNLAARDYGEMQMDLMKSDLTDIYLSEIIRDNLAAHKQECIKRGVFTPSPLITQLANEPQILEQMKEQIRNSNQMNEQMKNLASKGGEAILNHLRSPSAVRQAAVAAFSKAPEPVKNNGKGHGTVREHTNQKEKGNESAGMNNYEQGPQNKK